MPTALLKMLLPDVKENQSPSDRWNDLLGPYALEIVAEAYADAEKGLHLNDPDWRKVKRRRSKP